MPGLACLAGGDTLSIGDGTYSEHIGDTPSETPGAIRPPSGLSWEQPTIIQAAHPHMVTLNKPSSSVNYVVFLAHPTTQYISIEGLVLDGRGHGDCVWIGPASHLRLTGNVIKNCGGNGIFGSVDDQDQGGSAITRLPTTRFLISRWSIPAPRGCTPSIIPAITPASRITLCMSRVRSMAFISPASTGACMTT